MPEVAELSREELMNYIASVRGDQVAVLMEIASEEELKTYLQSLVNTAELLGEGIPGLVAPPEEDEGEGDEGAEAPAAEPAAQTAAPAKPAPAPTQAPASPASAQPAPPPPPADGQAAAAPTGGAPANVDALRHQVMGLLKELAAETKTASPQQLGALRLALRIAKAKMHAEGG